MIEEEFETCSDSGINARQQEFIQLDELQHLLLLLNEGNFSLFEEVVAKDPRVEAMFKELVEVAKKVSQFGEILHLKREDYPTLEIRLNEINIKLKGFGEFHRQWEQEQKEEEQAKTKVSWLKAILHSGMKGVQKDETMEDLRAKHQQLREKVEELTFEREHFDRKIAEQFHRKSAIIDSLKRERAGMEELVQELRVERVNMQDDFIEEEERLMGVQRERIQWLVDMERELATSLNQPKQPLATIELALVKIVTRKYKEMEAAEVQADHLDQSLQRREDLCRVASVESRQWQVEKQWEGK